MKHHERLFNFMEIAREEDLTLNSEQYFIKANSIVFLGSINTDRSMKPDPKKVEDNSNTLPLINKHNVQYFLALACRFWLAISPTFLKRVRYSATSPKKIFDLLKENITSMHLKK